jgi:segregation and condensation protein A
VPTVDLYHVGPIRASVTDAVTELVDELPRTGRITFRRLTESLVDRIEIVVRFLAVLELYKQGLVELDQLTSFGDITITWIGGDVDEAEEGGWMRAMATMDSYDG